MSRHAMLLLFAMAGVPDAHAGGAPLNTCTDPYWSNTLRCEILNLLAPDPFPPPQPVPAPPANVSAIKAFTRVDLVDAEARCVDGTRPILYVDKAVGPPSNRWLIVTTGGEFCSAQNLDGLPGFENGNECLKAYITQQGQLMGTATEPSTNELADENGNGIMRDDVQRNPLFARYNRVRVQKCGYDRHSGRATHLNVSATVPDGGPTITYDLYNHGQKIVLEALDFLRGPGDAGISYTTWINVGGVVTPTTEQLPSIVDAEQVVIAGHSAAAHGLYQNADRYAARLRSMPGFVGDVRAVHDAQFQPAAENEAAFDPNQNPDPTSFNTLFDQRMTGTTAAIGAYDAFSFYGAETSRFAEDYRAWSESPGDYAGILDASCVATHTPTNDVWKCADRLHVRLHHQSTPALLREDISDPNEDHNNLPFGHLMPWGTFGVYPHCDGVEPDYFLGSPCPPTINPVQNRARLLVQAAHFRDGLFTKSELATNADTSADAGTVFVWMPDCGNHSGIYDNGEFYGTSVLKDGSLKSYREFMQDFVLAPATGQIEMRVHGLDGALSECAPLLFRDSFE